MAARAPKTYSLVRVDVGDPERLLHGIHVGLAQDGGLGQLVGAAVAGEVTGDVEDLGLAVVRRARRVQGLEADDPLEAVLQAQPLEGAHGVDHVAVREYLKTIAAAHGSESVSVWSEREKVSRFEEGTYELTDAKVLENVLEYRVGLDVVVGQLTMDRGMVLIVVEAVADRLIKQKENC
jgi:hypothetical protein